MKLLAFVITLLFVPLTWAIESEDIYLDLVRAANLDSSMSEPYVNELVIALDEVAEEKGLSVDLTVNRKKERMLSIANTFFESEKYLKEMVSLYSTIFTPEEAKEMAIFYRSSTGKKFVSTRELFSLKLNSLRESLYGGFSEEITGVYLENLN